MLISITLMYYYADYSKMIYREIYYLWDKIKDLLLASTVTILLKKGKLKFAFGILSVFFAIRLLWQILELENFTYANRPFFIYVLFLLMGSATFWIALITEKRNKKTN